MAIANRLLILVLSDKGGTGKTTFCEALLERYTGAGINVRAFDADGTTGSFVMRYAVYDNDGNVLDPQPAGGVTPLFLHGTDDDRDTLTEAALETDADVILMDCPATALTQFAAIEAERSFTKDVRNEGITLVCVTVCTPFPESLANVNRSLDLFPTANHVVVFNEDQGDVPEDYALWFGDDIDDVPPATAKRRLEALGKRGAQIVLPRIKRKPLVLAAKWMLTLSEAMHDRRIRRAHRSRIEWWLEAVAAKMCPADHLLGFPPKTTDRDDCACHAGREADA